MNRIKGFAATTGEWINFMNSGDTFVSLDTINAIFSVDDYNGIDIVYGNSYMQSRDNTIYVRASSQIEKLRFYPVYRHGASFVRALVHKKYLFDLSKKKFEYALDFYCIHTLYQEQYKFRQVDVDVLTFLQDGVSNHPFKSNYLNFLISIDRKFSILALVNFVKGCIAYVLKKTFVKCFVRLIYAFIVVYVVNHLISHLPFWSIRKLYYKMVGMRIGEKTNINMGLYILEPRKIEIGSHTHINKSCFIDGRGGCMIGDNVSISYNVSIVTGSHDCNSSNFMGKYFPIRIDNYAWIGINATILQNVHVGEGAVVAAGAVVTQNVPPYTIVGGIPAKIIGHRKKDLDYHCSWNLPFV